MLLCPLASTERTAKITLSLEMGRVACVTLPTDLAFCQSAASVARHRISKPTAPAADSQVNVESFCSCLVSSFTLAGAAGADARAARVAEFTRATLAT